MCKMTRALDRRTRTRNKGGHPRNYKRKIREFGDGLDSDVSKLWKVLKSYFASIIMLNISCYLIW